MQLLEANARANGIDVPLIHNDPNMNTKSWSKDFSSAGGNVDLYGLDSYPSVPYPLISIVVMFFFS